MGPWASGPMRLCPKFTVEGLDGSGEDQEGDDIEYDVNSCPNPPALPPSDVPCVAPQMVDRCASSPYRNRKPGVAVSRISPKGAKETQPSAS